MVVGVLFAAPAKTEEPHIVTCPEMAVSELCETNDTAWSICIGPKASMPISLAYFDTPDTEVEWTELRTQLPKRDAVILGCYGTADGIPIRASHTLLRTNCSVDPQAPRFLCWGAMEPSADESQ